MVESAIDRFSSTDDLTAIHIDYDSIFKVNEMPCDILLTLAVPVYNGEKELYRTLESLKLSMDQIESKGEVELLFCNNNSSDDTEDIVKFFMCSTAFRCTYYKQPVNVGFDLNLDTIISIGSGKYVWFLGCGDLVKPNSFSRLLRKLKGVEVSNILLDFERFSERDGEIECYGKYKEDANVSATNVEDYSLYDPAISANIVNRCLWLKYIEVPFCTSGWGHVERIMQILSAHPNANTMIFMRPFFTLFMDENGWWMKPDAFKLHLNHMQAIKACDNVTSGKALNGLNRTVLLKSLLFSKKNGYHFTSGDLMAIKESCNVDVYILFRILRVLPYYVSVFLVNESRWALVKKKISALSRHFLK